MAPAVTLQVSPFQISYRGEFQVTNDAISQAAGPNDTVYPGPRRVSVQRWRWGLRGCLDNPYLQRPTPRKRQQEPSAPQQSAEANKVRERVTYQVVAFLTEWLPADHDGDLSLTCETCPPNCLRPDSYLTLTECRSAQWVYWMPKNLENSRER